ncbi:unnamed protein product [Owenia fusiformis]|uniref:JmjC domain-containing protein n=1 Tax=Owenia fusiformis TaxID=6347 RepID=A0A8S4NZY2_OWEFU|nr:unnamed protein product [Owenia fusiformis]
MSTKGLDLCFDELSLEAKELYLGDEVQYLDRAPSAIEFLRNWVCPNKPVIIKNAIDHWPALQRWEQHSYLRDKIGNKEVTVTATPNGYADAVHQNKFIMPEEKTMTMNSFLDIMETPENYNGVYYVQKQNSNFTAEFSEIIDDAEKEIPWASEALGKCPDAVNFWMGDGRAVTSMHKDHYENLYCVVSGQKHFILHPPTDLPFIPYGFQFIYST